MGAQPWTLEDHSGSFGEVVVPGHIIDEWRRVLLKGPKISPCCEVTERRSQHQTQEWLLQQREAGGITMTMNLGFRRSQLGLSTGLL